MKCLCCGKPFAKALSPQEEASGWHDRCIKAFVAIIADQTDTGKLLFHHSSTSIRRSVVYHNDFITLTLGERIETCLQILFAVIIRYDYRCQKHTRSPFPFPSS